MRAYFEIGGEKYYGYDVIFRHGSWLSRHGNVILDPKTWGNLKDIIAGNKVSVPDGSSVYVAPGCPVPHDDIRRNYKIKRDVDAGDFNVVNDISYNHVNIVKVIGIDKTSKTLTIADIVNPYKDSKRAYILNMPALYEDILMGRLTKPIANYR